MAVSSEIFLAEFRGSWGCSWIFWVTEVPGRRKEKKKKTDKKNRKNKNEKKEGAE